MAEPPGSAGVLCHVRRDAEPSHLGHESPGVVLVGTDGLRLAAGTSRRHLLGGIPLPASAAPADPDLERRRPLAAGTHAQTGGPSNSCSGASRRGVKPPTPSGRGGDGSRRSARLRWPITQASWLPTQPVRGNAPRPGLPAGSAAKTCPSATSRLLRPRSPFTLRRSSCAQALGRKQVSDAIRQRSRKCQRAVGWPGALDMSRAWIEAGPAAHMGG